ncbi:hypothetical protein Pve01_89550 [Planomonospora venezuelensis]|nr:hypothetical protein Pve01_89550 [Planomonospora venezuelensis]
MITMSVAKCLGLDDVDGPAMAAAGVAWQRWCHQEPDLAVVDDLLDLPDWTRRVSTATKEDLLARLSQLAQDHAEAAVVLAWLLLPGVTRLADSLRDLSPDIDALTAGELWLQIRTVPSQRCVAANILRAVRRSLLAELGRTEAAQRRDRTWASTTLCDNAEDLDLLAGLPELRSDAVFESSHLVQHALLGGVLSLPDASLLRQLADAAADHSAPARRGRAGLTSPVVVEFVSRYSPQSARSVRRRASMLMDRLGRYANEERLVNDLRHFVAAHDLPPMSLDEVLEEYLWQHIEVYANARDREVDESA